MDQHEHYAQSDPTDKRVSGSLMPLADEMPDLSLPLLRFSGQNCSCGVNTNEQAIHRDDAQEHLSHQWLPGRNRL
jgi:hypothetical protein